MQMFEREIRRRGFFRHTVAITNGILSILEGCQEEEDGLFPRGKAITGQFFNDEQNQAKIVNLSRKFVGADVLNFPGRGKLWAVAPRREDVSRVKEAFDRLKLNALSFGRDGSDSHLQLELNTQVNFPEVDDVVDRAFLFHFGKSQLDVAPALPYLVPKRPIVSNLLSFIFQVRLGDLDGDFVFVFNKGVFTHLTSATILPIRFKVAPTTVSSS